MVVAFPFEGEDLAEVTGVQVEETGIRWIPAFAGMTKIG